MNQRDTAKMLKRLIEAAGLKYRDTDTSFHGIRVYADVHQKSSGSITFYLPTHGWGRQGRPVENVDRISVSAPYHSRRTGSRTRTFKFRKNATFNEAGITKAINEYAEYVLACVAEDAEGEKARKDQHNVMAAVREKLLKCGIDMNSTEHYDSHSGKQQTAIGEVKVTVNGSGSIVLLLPKCTTVKEAVDILERLQ